MSFREWSTDAVLGWLGGVNLVIKNKYEAKFREEGVDGGMLAVMEKHNLKDELGMGDLHARRILAAIGDLKEGEEERPKKRIKIEAKTEEEEKAIKTEVKEEPKVKKEKKEEEEEEKAEEEEEKEEEEEEKEEEEEEEAKEEPAEPEKEVPEDTKSNEVEICFSFDTTGSMYPCLGQVKRNIESLIERLLRDVPHMKIALIAHGDYQDEGSTYLMKKCNFSCDKDILVDWVTSVGSTCGYDGDEAYEYVLREVKSLAWSPTCTRRALVMIGDANPHTTHNNKYNIQWRDEAKALAKMDVRIHGVHALGYAHSKKFYEGLADISGGHYLELSQFSSIRDLILGVAMAENEKMELLKTLENEVMREGRMTRTMKRVFDKLHNREPTAAAEVEEGLEAVSPGRFQVLDVEEKVPIKVFAQSQGLIFKTGKGFYEFTKPENISMKKEIVLQQKDTGDFYTGDKARTMLGISHATANRKLKPTDFDQYRVFVQSTSYNRNLMAGTKFLYEVDTDR